MPKPNQDSFGGILVDDSTDEFGGVLVEDESVDEWGGVLVSDEPTTAERPLEREPATFVEPPPIPPQGKSEVLVEGSTRATIPASLDTPVLPKPLVNVEGRTLEPDVLTSVEPGEWAFDPQRPLVNPEMVRAGVDIGTAMLPRDKFTEGVRRGVTGLAAGMTSPESIAMTPAFAVPFAGPALAMGLGAKSLGAGAGRTVAGLESGDAGEVGEGLVETGMGGLMTLGGAGAAMSRPVIPPRIVETIAKADAVGLTKSAQALADTVKKSQQRAATIEVEAKVEPAPVGERPGGTPPREAPPAPAPVEATVDTPPIENLPNRNPLVQVVGADGKKYWFTVDGTQDFSGFELGGKDRGAQRQLTAVDAVPVPAGQDALPAGGTTYQYRIEEAGYKLPEKLPSDAEIKTYREQQKAKPAAKAPVEVGVQPKAESGLPKTEAAPRPNAQPLPENVARANEKAIPAATEAATPAAADQTSIPARQTPVVEPRVGAVPENVSGAANAKVIQYLNAQDKAGKPVGRFANALDNIRKAASDNTISDDLSTLFTAAGVEHPFPLTQPKEWLQFVADFANASESKTLKAPAIEAARKGLAAKILDREVEYKGEVTSPRRIVDGERERGAIPIKKEVPDNTRYGVLQKRYEALKNNYPLGNPNHPLTIEFRKVSAELEAGPKKTKYYMERPDGSLMPLNKTEFDYAATKPAPARAAAFFERESEAAGLGRSSLPPTVADVRAQRARDVAQTDTIETQPVDPASGALIAPPSKPPAKPPTKPAAAAAEPARATLDDVYKIFEPAPKEGKGISQRVGDFVESFRTGFSSKFRPLNKLAEDIAAKVGGKAKDVAGIFEQLKGSSGKAEADVYRFDKDVSDLVKGNEKDFNAYVFLRRSLDRLQQDAADIIRAQAGENVPKLNRRRVSQYTIPQLEAKLNALSEQIGGEKLAQFNKAAEGFQTHMDQALRLQVESGRMSPEVYDAIKVGNQFYAPFKVMKYIEETVKPEGSGRKVDTVADFTKAMEGIDDPNVKLGDMLAAARQNLTLSRTLAEKNRAMQNITELAALDVDGNFVQKLKRGAEAPTGMEAVNVLENGVTERYAVNSDAAQAVANAGPGLPAGIVARWSSGLFRAGATTLNAAFQPVNLLFADAPRASLVSKYGVKGVTDLVRYPMDFVESLFSSISADVFGVKNKLFQDFLDSGAAGTTVQQYLTPEALRFKPETAASKSQAISGTILNTIPQFANAIEQTSKVLGVKRAMRIEGAESGAALAKQIPEAITEIRRFSGSPDFGRSGKWVEQYRLNLVYMFLNARIQGAVADVGRLTGRDGASRAAKTWLKMGTAVGIPTAYLYMLNNSDEYKADYAKRPEQEKQNYWLIPKDTFITGSNGEKIRDYWRVPKREIAQWMGNAVESGLDFANERDPDAFWKWAGGMAESIAPVNIRGNTLQERGESVLSGTHPFIKAPIETFSGRDTYRHRPIVPDSQKKASPEQQYDERTPDVFKTLADKMPDVAPEVFRSPKMLENLTKNFTAGLLTQFLPRQPVEGRSKAENMPLTQRFQAVPYTDSSEFDQRIQKFERESADEQLERMRDAKAIMDTNKGAKPDVLIREMIKKHGRDEKLAERIVDLYAAEQRGITPQERRVLALPVTQRAEYLADELKGKTPEQKAALLRGWALKRILTERVAVELAPKIKPTTP